MKKIIFTLSLLLVVSIASASNETDGAINTKANTKTSLLIPTKSFSHPMTALLKVNVNKLTKPADQSVDKCIVEGKVTISTEEGDSVKLEFTITANTCKEARRVMNKLMEVFDD